MKKIIFFFKNLLFKFRLQRAISKAKHLANKQPGLYMVLNYKGRHVDGDFRSLQVRKIMKNLKPYETVANFY